MRNLKEQVKTAFCYQKLFLPFTVWTNCSSDLKIFTHSRPTVSNFKSSSQSLEHFFLTVGQNNFVNKIPFMKSMMFLMTVWYLAWEKKSRLLKSEKNPQIDWLVNIVFFFSLPNRMKWNLTSDGKDVKLKARYFRVIHTLPNSAGNRLSIPSNC